MHMLFLPHFFILFNDIDEPVSPTVNKHQPTLIIDCECYNAAAVGNTKSCQTLVVTTTNC